MFNTKHAQDILDYIDTHPQEHNQFSWAEAGSAESSRLSEDEFCGTTMCIAGTSVFLNEGNKGLFMRDRWLTSLELRSGIDRKAAKNLGLDTYQAWSLFYQWNESVALDLLRCVAAGDEKKFQDVVDSLREAE